MGAGKGYFRKVLDELTVVGGTPLISSITSYDSYFLSSSLSLSLIYLFFVLRGEGGKGEWVGARVLRAGEPPFTLQTK